HHMEYAARLTDETELPPEIIPQTPLGIALNDTLAYTVQGEWEHVSEYLAENLERFKCHPAIVRILNEPAYGPDCEERKLQMCYRGCLNTLMRHWLLNRQAQIKARMRECTDKAAQEELFAEYMKVSEKLKAYSSSR
ncbi:MAG: hypothetical protein D6820_17875, partial [Lentisphaerae bacterium]